MNSTKPSRAAATAARDAPERAAQQVRPSSAGRSPEHLDKDLVQARRHAGKTYRRPTDK
jgi:hypothetical protein